ncbi:hypothetical protein QFZ37_002303 [Chryseobacterium ginsenosidimutans]|nr:hypothetical protein [Chryseobacterium ginsenosidimutans]MDQ0593934.1 hypothetical protein [Chryseobacterium ginsenosidimutans]
MKDENLYSLRISPYNKKIPSFFEGIIKKRFGIKYLAPDFDMRDTLGLPETE